MAATLGNLQILNYLHAVTALYFPALDLQILRVLLDIGRRQWFAWLGWARSRRQLERGVNPQQLAIDLSDLQFAKVHQWGQGELADDRLVDVKASCVLTDLAGATRGEARAAIRAQFDALSRDMAECATSLRASACASANTGLSRLPELSRNLKADVHRNLKELDMTETYAAAPVLL